MLSKMSGKKLIEYESHLYILGLNNMWEEWIGGIWCLFIIFDNYESRFLFAYGQNKKKNGTRIHDRGNKKQKFNNTTDKYMPLN